mmetsp:Transcript_30437/g.61150  ORF Transcript_30437/g.61150 Transcript_30437/m.61150 type:complete len:186 (+) Transcript_30437:3244-3801(+)
MAARVCASHPCRCWVSCDRWIWRQVRRRSSVAWRIRRDVRIAALSAMGHLDAAVLAEHAAAVTPLLGDVAAHVRLGTARLLGQLRLDALLTHASLLVRRLLVDHDWRVRAEAMDALSKLELDVLVQHTETLVDGVEHADTREAAAEALTSLGQPALALHTAAIAQRYLAHTGSCPLRRGGHTEVA